MRGPYEVKLTVEDIVDENKKYHPKYDDVGEALGCGSSECSPHVKNTSISVDVFLSKKESAGRRKFELILKLARVTALIGHSCAWHLV